jgi:hypothetical protein
VAKLTPKKIVSLLIAGALAIAAAAWGTDDYLHTPPASAWTKTRGKVIHVWMEPRKSYRTLFGEFAYDVAGTTYTSSTYRYKEKEFPAETKPGDQVDVYYLPDHPEIAVIDRTKPMSKLFTALALIGILAFGMAGAVLVEEPFWMRSSRK